MSQGEAKMQGTIEDNINRELANLPSGAKAFTLNNVKIFAAPGVLRCLGLSGSAHGDMEAALGAGGVLRKGSGVYAALTNNGLPPSYIQSEIDDDNELTDFDASEDSPINLAIAQYDTREGSRGSLRGFALLQVKNEDDEIIRDEDDDCDVRTATMELKVLGNKMGPAVQTRGSKIFPRGGNIIRLVQFMGSKLNRGVFLYGLESVISLYHYFGWRVTSARHSNESNCNNTGTMVTRQKAAPTLAAAFIKKYGLNVDTFNATQLKNREKDGLNDEKYESKLTKLLDAYKGKGFYEKLASSTNEETINKSKQATIAEKVEDARDMGYPMLLCRKDNPYSSVSARVTNSATETVSTTGKRKRGGNKLAPMLIIEVEKSVKKAKTVAKKGGTKRRKHNKKKYGKKTKKKALKKRHRKSKKARKFRKGKKRTHRKKY
jgi:hypothetical protein